MARTGSIDPIGGRDQARSFYFKQRMPTDETRMVDEQLKCASLFGCRDLFLRAVKFTQYFHATRQRADRSVIQTEWIRQAVENPVREVVQQDGRIRRWACIAEMDNRYLRVILLADGETVHNAFFDRSFTP
jgi:hypothetical protein